MQIGRLSSCPSSFSLSSRSPPRSPWTKAPVPWESSRHLHAADYLNRPLIVVAPCFFLQTSPTNPWRGSCGPRQKTGWSLLYSSRKHLPHAVAPHDPNQPFRTPWPVISIRRFGFLASRVTLVCSNVSFAGFFVSSTKNRLRLIETIVLMRGVNLGWG